MAKKLLSFLGTNYYIRTIYTIGDSQSTPHRFIQASLAELICKDWRNEDSIHIFLTKDAEEKNWNDPPKNSEEIKRQKEYDWENENYKGLSKIFDSLNLPFSREKITPVRVAEGWKEEERWEIFNKIVAQVNDNDEIYFDMTHSFRYLPMLAIIALNYIRVVKKNIKIRGIYYGAFEALGPAYQVKVLPIEQRKAPVIDLIGFENLMRWTAGVDRFVGTGDASILSSLVKEKELNEASAEKKLVESMEEFGNIMATCRGRKIGEGAKAVKNSIEEFKVSLEKERKPGMSPLVHLLGKIEDKMKGFADDDIKNGLEAVKWCINHNMTQQGYTILEELIITWLAKEYYKNELYKIYEVPKRLMLAKILHLLAWYEIDDKSIEKLEKVLSKDKLKIISKFFKSQRFDRKLLYKKLKDHSFSDEEIKLIINYAYVFDNDLNKEKWDKSLKDKRNITKVEETKNIKNIAFLAEYFSELANEYRNDLGHAGCREKPKTSSELITELENYFKQVRNFI